MWQTSGSGRPFLKNRGKLVQTSGKAAHAALDQTTQSTLYLVSDQSSPRDGGLIELYEPVLITGASLKIANSSESLSLICIQI